MPRSTSKKAKYQAAADKAIRDQLAHRKALVGAIGAAEEKYEQQQNTVAEAQQQLDVLASEVADAYNTAIEGGWTAAELKGLGINRPDAKPTKAKSGGSKTAHSADNSGSSPDAPSTDNSDSSVSADAAPESSAQAPHHDPVPSFQ